jgi:hypothetical protein
VTASRLRFLLEAAFEVCVAAVCWAAQLSWRGILPAMAGAWVLVTSVERNADQDHSGLRSGRLTFLFGRGRQTQAHDATEPLPIAESPRHVNVLAGADGASEPTPPEPEPAAPDSPAPEPAPPAPDPEPRRPEPEQPTPQLRPVPPPQPPPVPVREEPDPLAEPAVAYLPQADGAAAREWNIWELERIAHKSEGDNAARDDELAFLLLELRQFANADGQLPATFDVVVRESFAELLYTAV